MKPRVPSSILWKYIIVAKHTNVGITECIKIHTMEEVALRKVIPALSLRTRRALQVAGASVPIRLRYERETRP